MSLVDLIVTGEDADEAALLLKIPALGDGSYGWRGLLPQAALLRLLKIRELQQNLGYELEIEQRSTLQG